MKYSVVESAELPGLGEIISRRSQEILSETVGEAKRIFSEQGRFELVPGPAKKEGRDVEDICDFIVHGRLVESMEEIECPIPWLEIHVPPGGRAAMNVAREYQMESNIELTAFGSGLGLGRKQKIKVTDATEDRSECATHFLCARIVPKIYQRMRKKKVVLDVVGIAGERLREMPRCPFCGIGAESILKERYRLEPWIDLRRFSSRDNRTMYIERAHEIGMKLGVSIPGLEDSNVALGVKLSTTMTLEVKYTLMPGQWYQPYRLVHNIPPHSPMWAIK